MVQCSGTSVHKSISNFLYLQSGCIEHCGDEFTSSFWDLFEHTLLFFSGGSLIMSFPSELC